MGKGKVKVKAKGNGTDFLGYWIAVVELDVEMRSNGKELAEETGELRLTNFLR
jgi:hypothetical protein